jgi:hypothetical protein
METHSGLLFSTSVRWAAWYVHIYRHHRSISAVDAGPHRWTLIQSSANDVYANDDVFTGLSGEPRKTRGILDDSDWIKISESQSTRFDWRATCMSLENGRHHASWCTSSPWSSILSKIMLKINRFNSYIYIYPCRIIIRFDLKPVWKRKKNVHL